MPKASKGRKKATKIGTVQRRPAQPPVQTSAQASGASQTAASSARVSATAPGNRAGRRDGRLAAPGTTGLQSVIFPGMVALGCWGMAFTLVYFYTTDPNRFLFAGMAALMGLFWTYSLYMRYSRIRKARKTGI